MWTLSLWDIYYASIKYHLHYQAIAVDAACEEVLILGSTGNEQLFAACSF